MTWVELLQISVGYGIVGVFVMVGVAVAYEVVDLFRHARACDTCCHDCGRRRAGLPEPETLALLAIGAVAVTLLSKRK